MVKRQWEQGGNMDKRLYCGFCEKGWGRKAKQAKQVYD